MNTRLWKRVIGCAVLVALLCASALAEEPPVPDDGLYLVNVSSSSDMFRIVKCVLRVRGGAITATLTLSGQGYGYLFVGTGAEADAAPKDTWVPFALDAEGKKTFSIQIPSLDRDLDVAAYSIKYSKWYDRVLNFQAQSLRDYAEIPRDGAYTVDALSNNELLNGVRCELIVVDGLMTAKLPLPDGAQEVDIDSLDKDVSIALNGEEIALFLDSTTLEEKVFAAKDGVYSIGVTSDSPLFRVDACTLKIKDGKMIAVLSVSGSSYERVYLGLAKDARMDETGWIQAALGQDGATSYTLEVAGIDQDIPIATYSAKKNMWYNRTLRFESDSMAALS